MTTTNARKSTYNRPSLVVYGSIKEITQAVGAHGALDGGSVGGKTKTG
jgi:hypothetical protein